MTRKKHIVNTIFATFAIISVMVIAVGGLFIAGIVVGAECALAEVSSLSLNSPYVFGHNNTIFVSQVGNFGTFSLSVDFLYNGSPRSISISSAPGRVSAYSPGYYISFFSSSSLTGLTVYYLPNGSVSRYTAYYSNSEKEVTDVSISFSSIQYTQNDAYSLFLAGLYSPLPSVDTLSSSWHINSVANLGNIDVTTGDQNNLYSFDFSALDNFKFVYDNVVYAFPQAIYAYVTFNTRVGVLYAFVNSVGNSSTAVHFFLSPAYGQFALPTAYIYVGSDFPSDLADWDYLPSSGPYVYLYNSSVLTSSAQTSDEILAFNLFASFWQDTVIVGDVTYTPDTDPRALVLHEEPWDLYSVSFSNLINSTWYPATVSYDTIEIQCAYRQDANTWQDWYDSEYFNISDYVAIMPTIASYVGATDIFYPVFKYRYRGRVSVNGTYYYSNWHEIDPTVYQPNYDVMKSIYDSGFDYGENVGHQEGYVDGINDANEYNFIVMALDIVRLPFDITFGTWHDDDPTTVDVDESGYRGGLFTFTLFGQDLRTFVLTLVSLCVIVRVVSFILTSKATEA